MRRGTSRIGARGLAAAIAATALAGCGFQDVTVKLPRPEEVATGSHRGEGREILILGPIASRRPRAHCGMRKNGYNAELGKVLCAEPPEAAIDRMLSVELAAAGFKVLRDPRQASPSAIALGVVLEEAFFEEKLNYLSVTYETDIALTMRAQTRSGLLAERRFYVKGEEATYWGGLEDMERTWQSAARQLVASVVGAIANLADQFPAAPNAAAEPAPPPPESPPPEPPKDTP